MGFARCVQSRAFRHRNVETFQVRGLAVISVVSSSEGWAGPGRATPASPGHAREGHVRLCALGMNRRKGRGEFCPSGSQLPGVPV